MTDQNSQSQSLYLAGVLTTRPERVIVTGLVAVAAGNVAGWHWSLRARRGL